jgi:CheY-like chemotaxis protein
MAEILVVDDNADILALMADILNNAGHKATVCASGPEAIRLLGIEPDDASLKLPDLLVTDIMMPGTDGYTVSAAVRNNPRTRSIPILVVSALHGLSRPVMDNDGFLAKPFTPEDLIGRVAKILNRRKAQG